MDNTLLIVDGNSIINRAFFGLGRNTTLTAPDGTPSGAVLTFFNIFLKHYDKLEPSHVLIAFDTPHPTFRHEQFDGYKAGRAEMPEGLALQMPMLKSCLAALKLPQTEAPGWEADDLIGSAAALAEEAGLSVYVLSGDKDDFQLISEQTAVIYAGNARGPGDTLYDRDTFFERYGIEPGQFTDVRAIMGDSSDKIPGVKGIGEKGALELIGTYGTLDGIYDHIDEIKGARQKNLIEQKEMAYLSQDLSTIRTDAPLELTLDEMRYEGFRQAEALPVFRSYGFSSLIKRMDLDEPTPAPDAASGIELDILGLTLSLPDEITVTRLERDSWLSAVRPLAESGSLLFISAKASEIDLPEPGLHEAACCLYQSDRLPDKVYYCPAARRSDLQELMDLFADQNCTLGGYDLKHWLRDLDLSMQLAVFDTKSAAYLTGDLASQEEADLWNRLSSAALPPALAEEDVPEVVRSAWTSAVLARPLRNKIEEMDLSRLARDCDMPLTVVLSRMEHRGFLIDQQVLDDLKIEFEETIARLEQEIYEMAGQTFNINSTQQLGTILYDNLGLPAGKKGKSGVYSTDASELERLMPLHPIVGRIVGFRQISKLNSTFVIGLSAFVEPDSRIRSDFNQNYTNTGRLSSRDPNLQNIPVREAVGREIRKAFVAAPGYTLLDADYSQIELRLLAHLSGDERMVDAFNRGDDIHRTTAMSIFGVDEDQVTPEMRAAAKTTNFSIIYGISDFGLAQRLGLTVKEAHLYIEGYYNVYTGVKPFMEQEIELARERGYSETMFGRRRMIPELKSKNRNLRQFGERVAMNSPVQGSAADIIRIAMVNCARALEDAGIDGGLVSQIHDELIIEVRREQADEAAAILQESMQNAADLKVPLVAEVQQADSWFDAKG